MGVNRVDFGGNTLIDLTGDTLESAEQLLKGIIAHAKDGSVITGLMEAGGGGGNLQSISGSYTPAELETEMTIEHNLGVIPKAILVWTGVYGSSTVTLAVFINKNNYSAISAGVFQFWANKMYEFGDVSIRDSAKNVWDKNKAMVGSVANIALHFSGGVEHKWMVFW